MVRARLGRLRAGPAGPSCRDGTGEIPRSPVDRRPARFLGAGHDPRGLAPGAFAVIGQDAFHNFSGGEAVELPPDLDALEDWLCAALERQPASAE